ncbi:hypothetical protein [Edaphobacter sp.]|uniref:hypothetical protein n=1 Tax=Edaphobacter sp. TaxID=1934404 RepID=UPI002DBC3339|nr:hypothetical protein [Edaphobacter sp.]HEU5340304.1 hypothetical protein [Edaphobacter sp.]
MDAYLETDEALRWRSGFAERKAIFLSERSGFLSFVPVELPRLLWQGGLRLQDVTFWCRRASTMSAMLAFHEYSGMTVSQWVKDMNQELTRLIEAARKRPFSDAEREAQRRSFAYGNAKIENSRITREMIAEADEKIKTQLKAK